MQDVVDVGSAEAVDALCIVANDTDALPSVGEEPDNLVLSEVCVLILIDENKMEALLPCVCHLGIVLQQEPHIEKQVVKVHRVGLLQPFLIAVVYLGHKRTLRHLVAVAELTDGVIG